MSVHPFIFVVGFLVLLGGCDCSGNVGLRPVPEDDAVQTELDAGSGVDASVPDSGFGPDAGTPDSGSDPDAGAPDSGSDPDAGAPDSGSDPDAGAPDSGFAPDAGTPDSGTADAGTIDAGVRYLGLDWVKIIDGPYSPSMVSRPDGGLIGSFLIAYNTPVVIGAGEPNQVTYSGHFSDILVWLDRRSGALQNARRINTNVQGQGGAAGVNTNSLAVAPNGDAVIWGKFLGSMTFSPDTAPNPQTALTQTNSGVLDSAIEPYLARYDQSGAVRSFARGRTPAPLWRTADNWPISFTVLPDGDAIVHGAYALGGFRFPDGQPGQATLTTVGTRNSYLARVRPDGSALWVRRLEGFGPQSTLTSGSDGSIYFAVIGAGTLFADTSSPFVIPAQPRTDGGVLSMSTIVKLDPAGQVAWTRRQVSGAPYVSPPELAVLHGGLIATGIAVEGLLELKDGNGATVGSLTAGPYGSGWISRLELDGTFSWLRPFEDAFWPNGVVEWGSGYYALTMLLAAGQAGLEQGALPALPANLDGGYSNLGVALSASGQRTRIDVLGENMITEPHSLASTGDGLVGSAYRIGGSAEPIIVLRDGGVPQFAALPPAPNNTGIIYFHFTPP